MSERMIRLETIDHGGVTLACPAWCAGHSARPGYRIDITHVGPDRPLTLPTRRGEVEHLITALESRPFVSDPFLRRPFVTVSLDGDWFPGGPENLDAMADRLAEQAHVLHGQADELRALLAAEGEGER